MIQLFRGDLYDKFGEERLSLYKECVVPEDIHTPMEGNRIPRGGVGPKGGNFRGHGGFLTEVFPQWVSVRLLSY